MVRPGLRGHGRSEAGLDQPLTLERLGPDLLELFDHLGIAPAHVMGSSAGGIIAMDAALQSPSRFASLALFAATPGIHPSRPKRGNWLERVGRNGVRHFLSETVHDRFGEASPEMIRWYLDTAEGVTPEFLGCFAALGEYARYRSSLSGRPREFAILSMARGNQYAGTHHVPSALKASITQAELDALNAGEVPATTDDTEKAAIAYARAFRHHGVVDDDTFAAVQQKLGDRGITDLMITCAYFLGLGSIVNAFRVPLEPDFPPQMKPVHD